RSCSATPTPRRSCRSCRRCSSRTRNSTASKRRRFAPWPAKRRFAVSCRSRCRECFRSGMASSGRLLRDKLLARMRDADAPIDHQRLAADVLGIRGAPPDLARRLVAQALVVEDRREAWRWTGDEICRGAPAAPGVYILKDETDRALYVGKAVNVRRRL